MEYKTNVHAEAGRQDLTITREFELPVELLFRAYTEAEFLEQWMGTSVRKLENKMHGSYRFVTTDPHGNQHGFNGTIHEFVPGSRITRTFEMENGPAGIQLEFLEFEPIGEERCKLSIHSIFRSVEQRDQLLKLPFTYGINMAHNRLQEIAQKQH